MAGRKARKEIMQALIDVFRMQELSAETRIRVIEKLGVAINYELGSNVTEDIVKELTDQLKAAPGHIPATGQSAPCCKRSMVAVVSYWKCSECGRIVEPERD